MLAGLIAHLFEVTLQDDMAAATRRLVQLGHDVINRSRDEDNQASAAQVVRWLDTQARIDFWDNRGQTLRFPRIRACTINELRVVSE